MSAAADDPYWEYAYAFQRHERRRTRRKRDCDCGCVIDGGEPYEYVVFKMNGDTSITQIRTCEPCHVNYAGSGGWHQAT